jgi:anti-sigma B factor antagonist
MITLKSEENMQLNVTTKEKSPGVQILSLDGSLNSKTSPMLEKEVNRALGKSPETLVFDLEKLAYISSAGIRVILIANKAMKKKDGKAMFANMQPQIKKVFEIVNALPNQQVFSSVEEMDTYLDAMQRRALE